LGYNKNYVNFVIPIHVTTYAERMMKIGLEVAEIFGYTDFCCLVQKSADVTLAISEVTRPNVTKLCITLRNSFVLIF